MKQEQKYVVIPTKYLKYISPTQRTQLDRIIESIVDIRKSMNKDHQTGYIVCKDTEPYANTVWNLILLNQIDDFSEQMKKACDYYDNSTLSIDEQMQLANSSASIAEDTLLTNSELDNDD